MYTPFHYASILYYIEIVEISAMALRKSHDCMIDFASDVADIDTIHIQNENENGDFESPNGPMLFAIAS